MMQHKSCRLKVFALIIAGVSFVSLARAQFNVKAFGAKADGNSLDTRAIQQAIDEAFKASGGTVEVPAGTYKIGTLILKDNVELHLQHGAVLLGSSNYKDYTNVQQVLSSRTKELYAKYFMVFAEGAKNVSITGSGTIHGNGLFHFEEVKPQNLRPFMIRLVSCNNVVIRGVQLLEAANWTLHLLGCKDVRLDGLVVENKGEGNRDGIDIDACQRVIVANSRFSTTDDAIVMKATNDSLCQNIAISNCLFREIGGSAIKTGTESNGGFKNITVSNCVITDIEVHAGIELMTVDGGMMQNIVIDNIIMDKVATPFFIRLGLRARPYETGQYVKVIHGVRDIQLSNISAADTKFPSSIIGLHSKKISNISISNYTVRYSEKQEPSAYNQVDFLEFDYPAAVMFKKLPAFGLYCRSVQNLQLHNLNMYAISGDDRSAITLDRVENVSLSGVNASAGKQPMVHLRNADDITITQSRSFDRNELLVQTELTTVNRLRFSNNSLHPGQTETRGISALPDATVFEDFESPSKFIVKSVDTILNMPAYDLSKGKYSIRLKIPSTNSAQLCLLVLNQSATPKKIIVKYAGITQEFWINWEKWGWAPVSLMKRGSDDTPVEFELSVAGNSGSVQLARAYIREQDTGFTD